MLIQVTSGIHLDPVYRQYMDSLVYALLASDIAQVQALAACGVGVSPADSWIIYEACLQGPVTIHALTLNPLIDLNPTIPGQNGDRVLHHLLRTLDCKFKGGKHSTIATLLRSGVNPVTPDRNGNTALHILAGDINGFNLLKFLLLDESVIPNHTSRKVKNAIDHRNVINGNTPLVVAVQQRQIENARLLLSQGANPHIRGEFGRTALYFAVARDLVDIAELLLQYGAMTGIDTIALSPNMSRIIDTYSGHYSN